MKNSPIPFPTSQIQDVKPEKASDSQEKKPENLSPTKSTAPPIEETKLSENPSTSLDHDEKAPDRLEISHSMPSIIQLIKSKIGFKS